MRGVLGAAVWRWVVLGVQATMAAAALAGLASCGNSPFPLGAEKTIDPATRLSLEGGGAFGGSCFTISARSGAFSATVT